VSLKKSSFILEYALRVTATPLFLLLIVLNLLISVNRMKSQAFQVSGISTKLRKLQQRHLIAITSLLIISLLASIQGAPADNKILDYLDGFFTGLAHPVLVLDNLILTIVVGLLSTMFIYGVFIPIGFVLMTLLGTVIPTFGINIPNIAIAIAFVIMAFTVIFNTNKLIHLLLMVMIACLSGLFYGGQGAIAIVDTPILPQLTYLLGLALTQAVISLSAKQLINVNTNRTYAKILRKLDLFNRQEAKNAKI
jgi:urease accessory protein